MKIDFNYKKMLQLRGIPLVLAGTVLFTGLTGCSKRAECEVDGDHAHLYTSEEGYRAWYNEEYLEYGGYNRNDEYISLDDEEVKLNKFLAKKDLIRLDENLDTILSKTEDNQDYVEYRYSYKKRVLRPIGKSLMYMTVTRYSWTSDPNHSGLTGETRNCHYVYQGCNVYKDEHGDYVVIPSEEVDDVKDLIGKYEYVRKEYSKVIDLESGEEVNYEDGPEDENELEEENNATNQSYESKIEVGPKLVKTYENKGLN